MQDFFTFVSQCPTVWQTAATVRSMLTAAGFSELEDGCCSDLSEGGKYFVRRSSALIAFVFRKDAPGFLISGTHGDSPSFRLRFDATKNASAYLRTDVERYGGMICYSWLDRPLSVAGRVIVSTENGLESRLCHIDRDLFVIPSVSIHFNRSVNDGYKFDPAADMLPLFALKDSGASLLGEIAASVGCREEEICGHDLFLYVRQEGTCFGADNAFFAVPRLDDLGCVYGCLQGFLHADASASLPVFALFDNEEVGSDTKQGAASPFLCDVLSALGGSRYTAMLKNSFLVSADNGHAQHPNHPELSDPVYAPVLGGGILIKYNASQKYATDGLSHAVFSKICQKAGVKTQLYYNKANVAGGSTLGSISDTVVPVNTVDIGLPQLAMHSAVETGACSDMHDLRRAMTAFFGSCLRAEKDCMKIE